MYKKIGAVVVVVAIVIGAYVALSNKGDTVMVNTTDMPVMKIDSDAPMKNADTMMMMKDTHQDSLMETGDSMMKQGDISMAGVPTGEMMKVGSYEAFAPEKVAQASASHNVVLFFRASWCPTCNFADMNIKANLGKIPSNLTILDVDYDNSKELKQKYGVTLQHTFVQVDMDGNLIKKWSGSPTLAALVSQVK